MAWPVKRDPKRGAVPNEYRPEPNRKYDANRCVTEGEGAMDWVHQNPARPTVDAEVKVPELDEITTSPEQRETASSEQPNEQA